MILVILALLYKENHNVLPEFVSGYQNNSQ